MFSCGYIDHLSWLFVDMVSHALFVQSCCNFLSIHVDAAVVTNDGSSLLGWHNIFTLYVLLTLCWVAFSTGAPWYFGDDRLFGLLKWCVSLWVLSRVFVSGWLLVLDASWLLYRWFSGKRAVHWICHTRTATMADGAALWTETLMIIIRRIRLFPSPFLWKLSILILILLSAAPASLLLLNGILSWGSLIGPRLQNHILARSICFERTIHVCLCFLYLG